MEWVETTAKTVDAAREQALDQLGVAADEAEFDIVEEPKAGLFGRVRGEARVRARVKPTPVRPKQERRRRGGGRKKSNGGSTSKGSDIEKNAATASHHADDSDVQQSNDSGSSDAAASRRSSGQGRNGQSRSSRPQNSQNGEESRTDRTNDQTSNQQDRNSDMSNDTIEQDKPEVSPQEVGDAAVAFMDGLVSAFGVEGTTDLAIDGTELDVRVQGDGLGLLVGHGGRTLQAVQDLVRVAAQRRLGDHETRLRIDVARYRERRTQALMSFAADVAEQVRSSGTARSLEPMNSADRKVIHDALNDQDGVESRSEGDDPNRRVVVSPT